jgi:hypothetical protein
MRLFICIFVVCFFFIGCAVKNNEAVSIKKCKVTEDSSTLGSSKIKFKKNGTFKRVDYALSHLFVYKGTWQLLNNDTLVLNADNWGISLYNINMEQKKICLIDYIGPGHLCYDCTFRKN